MSLSQDQIANELALWSVDPEAFVCAVFPWGQGTLVGYHGPHEWQRKELRAIGEAIRSGGILEDVIRRSTASGHGVGKSCLVAWLILWAMSTMPDTRGVVTANTENQLRTKTWAELAKWHNLLIGPIRDLTDVTATAIFGKTSPQTWRIDAIPWSINNTEAFAGLHNAGKRLLVIFDEASAIDDQIWEVTEGALTDAKTEIIWCVYGNPTRLTGRFSDTWGRYRHRWVFTSVDSRFVPGTNRKQIEDWISDYGEESDFVRVRVRGMPPKAAAGGFFSAELLSRSMTAESFPRPEDEVVMSIDVSRGGEDDSVLLVRKGLNACLEPWIILRGHEVRDSMRLVSIACDAAERWKPDAIIVDETGIGGPIVDRLTQIVSIPVYGVHFSARSPNPKQANMRMHMYWNLREAMLNGLIIPEDPVLEKELLSIEYQHDKQDRMILTPKDKMRQELGFSPDRADALALSFALPIHKSRRALRPVKVVGMV
jgi:hypothetical protein